MNLQQNIMNRMYSINSYLIKLSIATILLFTAISCGQESDTADETSAASFNLENRQDTTNIAGTATGFSGPEAVRYDPDQDIYFVSNFNGDGNDRDENGFISKISPDGTIEEMEFITGTSEHPLHAPRGMYITGDTLWTCDVDGVHGFDRNSGEQVTFIDFTSFEPGFLNDIAAGPDGTLYVTDTVNPRLFSISNSEVSLAVVSIPHAPNGVTLDEEEERVILAPWNEARTFYAWNPATSELEEARTLDAGGNFDGIEIVEGSWVIASQVDSSLHISGENSGIAVKTRGKPADIGIDTQRQRVAVPYIDLNRVDIWDLPVE